MELVMNCLIGQTNEGGRKRMKGWMTEWINAWLNGMMNVFVKCWFEYIWFDFLIIMDY